MPMAKQSGKKHDNSNLNGEKWLIQPETSGMVPKSAGIKTLASCWSCSVWGPKKAVIRCHKYFKLASPPKRIEVDWSNWFPNFAQLLSHPWLAPVGPAPSLREARPVGCRELWTLADRPREKGLAPWFPAMISQNPPDVKKLSDFKRLQEKWGEVTLVWSKKSPKQSDARSIITKRYEVRFCKFPLSRSFLEDHVQDLFDSFFCRSCCARSPRKISLVISRRDLCSSFLWEISWQDVCSLQMVSVQTLWKHLLIRCLFMLPVQALQKPLGKISVQDLCKRSLDKISIRSVVARSLYKLEEVSWEDLSKRSA